MRARSNGCLAAAMLIVTMAGGCAAYDVDSSHDPKADFGAYWSFAFMPERTLYVASDHR